MLARRFEQPSQKRGGATHLPFRLQPLEAQHHRSAMLANPRRKPHDVLLVELGRLQRDMAEALGQGNEIPLGIDHDLLDLAGALLEQSAKQMRLARSRIALDQQPRREQFLKVDPRGLAAWAKPHVYADRHTSRLAAPPAASKVAHRARPPQRLTRDRSASDFENRLRLR